MQALLSLLSISISKAVFEQFLCNIKEKNLNSTSTEVKYSEGENLVFFKIT